MITCSHFVCIVILKFPLWTTAAPAVATTATAPAGTTAATTPATDRATTTTPTAAASAVKAAARSTDGREQYYHLLQKV